MVVRMLAAVLAGGLIGFERNYHGRPAGFRTHTLVCTASSLLMLVTVYEAHWMPKGAALVQLDPTRMAQGIMTGIGFLGAGVIVREGLSVRGLTTAASIWITAALGVLAGIGAWIELATATALALVVLSVFRRIERLLPTQTHAELVIVLTQSQAESVHACAKRLSAVGISAHAASIGEDRERGTRRLSFRLKSSDSRGRFVAAVEQALHDMPGLRTWALDSGGE